MLARLFQWLLLVCATAMLLFLIGFILAHTALAFLAQWLFPLASRILLVAMSLLAVLAAWGVVIALAGEIGRYFSREARARRRVWSLYNRQAAQRRRVVLESRQIQYKNHFQRQRLLVANNRKHLRVLFHEVNQELMAMKTQLPSDRYRALHKALRRSHQRGDAHSLLSVRGELLCR